MNTLINIRSAIKKYLKDICRNIDIVRDIEFVRNNRTLDGFLKSRTVAGLSRPTQHKEILTKEDLEKTATFRRIKTFQLYYDKQHGT
ncbi:hypothetical protein DPMN_148770 [Dreissena polymorpha]|uniref:Uncharacterized protein n=1 Tax=Dreissena polymorpha TaxID=45954 RepID=A0A9D4FBJ4_DREPO|nr:hypothetical protein DPMN_148770 [Dreissena polymorpha]